METDAQNTDLTLRLKGTFIDVIPKSSPRGMQRSHSEPRRHIHTPADPQENYLRKLCRRVGMGDGFRSCSEAGDRTPMGWHLKTYHRDKSGSACDLGGRHLIEDAAIRWDMAARNERAMTGGISEAKLDRVQDLAGCSTRESKLNDRERDISPCSWRSGHGDAGSDCEWRLDLESDASSNNSGRRKRQDSPRMGSSDGGGRKRDKNSKNTVSPRCSDTRSRSKSEIRHWAGPASEPAGRFRYSSSASSSCGVTPVRSKDEKENPPKGSCNTLVAMIAGKWIVADGSPLLGSIWTIEEGGRAWCNGKRFGMEYDIHESYIGSAIMIRNDGWSACMECEEPGCEEPGFPQRLVWTRPGEANEIVWNRVFKKIELSDPSGTCIKKKGRFETPTQLRSKMQASAQLMSTDTWNNEGCLSSAMALIEDIPKIISEDMQRASNYVIDNMQAEVVAMKKQIRGGTQQAVPADDDRSDGRPSTEKIIKNLEVIPTMVQNLLESRVEKARSKVRTRVHGMIQHLTAIKEENLEEHEELISQMRMITEEVEQIAGEAVKQAAQECHAHASKQMDVALGALRDNAAKEAATWSKPSTESVEKLRWSDLMDNNAGVDHEFWSKDRRDGSANHMMEQAVILVQDRDNMPQSITNQVVADELLRARIRSGGGKRRGQANQSGPNTVSSGRRGGGGWQSFSGPVPGNPGSKGHPDLCLRPCLYYAQGNCTNGDQCLFCHMPHPKRPVRFDKLHRETLKFMPFGHFLSTMLPVLQQKASDLDLPADVVNAIETMWEPLSLHVCTGVPAVQGGEAGPDCMEETKLIAAQDGRVSFPPTPRQDGRTPSTWSSNASATGSDRSSRRISSFGGALQAMGFRPLLSMLLFKIPSECSDLNTLVEEVVNTVHNCTTAAVQRKNSSVSGCSSEERGRTLAKFGPRAVTGVRSERNERTSGSSRPRPRMNKTMNGTLSLSDLVSR